MYGSPIPWQPYAHGPCGPQGYLLWVAVPCAPVAPCPPRQPCGEVVLPRELAVDDVTSSKSDIVGGHTQATFTVEYVIDAAAPAPAVQVKLEAMGASSTWDATDLAAGYHVREAFLTAAPGTKVTLSATDAIARLRWCERICC